MDFFFFFSVRNRLGLKNNLLDQKFFTDARKFTDLLIRGIVNYPCVL